MRAVFLDRDGVINENRPDYVKSWKEIEFLPGAFESLRRLANTSYLIIVISNQSAINRGLVTSGTVDDIHCRMRKAIECHGGRIDGFFYCPHRPDERCDCRKPKSGLLLLAAQHFSLDLHQCYLVGDAATDLAAARAVGCHPILVLTGRGRESLPLVKNSQDNQTMVVDDISAAADWILSRRY